MITFRRFSIHKPKKFGFPVRWLINRVILFVHWINGADQTILVLPNCFFLGGGWLIPCRFIIPTWHYPSTASCALAIYTSIEILFATCPKLQFEFQSSEVKCFKIPAASTKFYCLVLYPHVLRLFFLDLRKSTLSLSSLWSQPGLMGCFAEWIGVVFGDCILGEIQTNFKNHEQPTLKFVKPTQLQHFWMHIISSLSGKFLESFREIQWFRVQTGRFGFLMFQLPYSQGEEVQHQGPYTAWAVGRWTSPWARVPSPGNSSWVPNRTNMMETKRGSGLLASQTLEFVERNVCQKPDCNWPCFPRCFPDIIPVHQLNIVQWMM